MKRALLVALGKSIEQLRLKEESRLISHKSFDHERYRREYQAALSTVGREKLLEHMLETIGTMTKPTDGGAS